MAVVGISLYLQAHLRAAHLRHHHIAHDNIDVIAFHLFQSIDTVCRRDDLVERFEQFGEDLQQFFIILDEQNGVLLFLNGLSLGLIHHVRLQIIGHRLRQDSRLNLLILDVNLLIVGKDLPAGRQRYGKRGPLSQLGIEREQAVMLIDNHLREGQTDTKTLIFR